MSKNFLIIGLLLINVIALLITFYDKAAAIRKKRRTPEKVFILLSLFGGGLGVFLGFNLFHHKTLHKKLYFGVFGIFLLETVILLLLISGGLL